MKAMRVKFTVGLLLRREFRRYLEYVRFSGAHIEWIEQKGWLDSEFLVRGPVEQVLKIQTEAMQWAER